MAKINRNKRELPKLREISSRTLESIRKETAEFIWVYDKDGNAKCERCLNEFVLPKTKHLEENYKCPVCGKRLKIGHKWRYKYEKLEQAKGYEYKSLIWGGEQNIRYDWRIVVDVLNEKEIVFRYVLVQRLFDKIQDLAERAREVFVLADNVKLTQIYRYENSKFGEEKWVVSTKNFFRECGLGYTWRRICCLYGSLHNKNNVLKKLRMIPELKYADLDYFFGRNCYEDNNLGYALRCGVMYEQLEKAGFEKLVEADKTIYNESKELTYNKCGKSLAEKIGLNKSNFERLRKYQTLEIYNYLKDTPNASDKDIERVHVLGRFSYENFVIECNFYHIKVGKTFQYIKKNVLPIGLSYRDYIDYIHTIDRLNYPIDNAYAYPKDFKQSKQQANDRYNEMYERIRNMTTKEKALNEAKKDEKIYLISKALRESKELRKWFDGADGLKVFVPESVGELVESGINLHNCLSNYGDRIANNNCLIFFIRRIEAPNEDYIAMEYANGKVEQIRLDKNQPVTDKKIINFADALARKLNEINARETIVKNAIRKVA